MAIGSDIDVLVAASRTEMLPEALAAAFKSPDHRDRASSSPALGTTI